MSIHAVRFGWNASCLEVSQRFLPGPHSRSVSLLDYRSIFPSLLTICALLLGLPHAGTVRGADSEAVRPPIADSEETSEIPSASYLAGVRECMAGDRTAEVWDVRPSLFSAASQNDFQIPPSTDNCILGQDWRPDRAFRPAGADHLIPSFSGRTFRLGAAADYEHVGVALTSAGWQAATPSDWQQSSAGGSAAKLYCLEPLLAR